MPKSDPAQALLKRLEKIERAQARLGDITTRILTQAELLAELLKVARVFAAQSSQATATGAKRATRGAKRTSSAKRTTRKAPSAPRAAAAKPVSSHAAAPAGTSPARSRRPALTTASPS